MDMNIFEFDDYKTYFQQKIREFPSSGHGQRLKIAKLMNIHTTMLTQIFKGKSHLTNEQALTLSGYLGLDSVETDYFMNLVQLALANSEECRDYFRDQLKKIKSKSADLKSRFIAKKILDDRDQAQFYSDWVYSAVNLLTAIEKYQRPNTIAGQLGISQKEVLRILRFLVSVGLSEEINGQYRIGSAQTFVGKDSPYLARHLNNWRTKAIERIRSVSEEELMYSNPIVIAEKDFPKIREKIVDFLKEFRGIADPSACEILCCLNIDWIKI